MTKIWRRDLPKLLKKFYQKEKSPFPNKADCAIVDLMEWLLRIPSKRPRIVQMSKELQDKILTPFELRNLAEIKKITNVGGSLKAHLGDLTKSIRNRESKKNDFFMSDWGLLHFHLGCDFENKNRVSRSKRVLIARFEDDIAYFIDIVDHGRNNSQVWGDTRLIKIIHDNWPDSVESSLLKDTRPSDLDIPASSYIKSRSTGFNLPVVINEKVFLAPGLGIATDGSSTVAVQKALEVCRRLENAENAFRKEVPENNAYLVLDTNSSVGFLVPSRETFYCAFNNSDNNLVSGFFRRLLSEIKLEASKPHKAYITPKRIRSLNNY